jgi:hypothetical protein
MVKLKNYVLTYHPKQGAWSGKVIKKRPSKLGRHSIYITKAKSIDHAWKKMSMRSYRGER